MEEIDIKTCLKKIKKKTKRINLKNYAEAKKQNIIFFYYMI